MHQGHRANRKNLVYLEHHQIQVCQVFQDYLEHLVDQEILQHLELQVQMVQEILLAQLHQLLPAHLGFQQIPLLLEHQGILEIPEYQEFLEYQKDQ